MLPLNPVVARTDTKDSPLIPEQLGRLTHYAFDAVLCMEIPSNDLEQLHSVFRISLTFFPTVSAFLAGVKRSTGLT